MFKSLFHYPRVFSRHANGPLAEERNTFLKHLASRGTPRSTLLRYARQLRVIAVLLDRHLPGPISREQIARHAQQWAQGQRRRGHAQGLKWPREHFLQVASAWCTFMGWWQEQPRPRAAYRWRIEAWASFLGGPEGLAETTVANYCWWASDLLEWLQEQDVPLRQITLGQMDRFMEQLSSKGLSRVTLATAAKALRRFLPYAHEQGWCRRDLAQGVLSPRLYRQENLPAGPAWSDVKRLIAATGGSTVGQLRNRAMLLLLAVYGLRSGEVRGLSLEDLDWPRRVLRVRRSKTARVQEYPLTTAMGQALRRYLAEARPDCARRELFLTRHAPFRQLSAGALYRVTHGLMERLEISSPKHGPHALRHACASYLLNDGLSLKEVGDHLGHRHLSATQIYAKVDLVGLRSVAAFDLGGLL
jgi:integrase/recombinase XerD